MRRRSLRPRRIAAPRASLPAQTPSPRPGCLILLLIAVLGSLWASITGGIRARQYADAPGCGSRSADPSLPACSEQTVLVDGKTWERGRRSASLFTLTVDDQAGRQSVIDVADHGLWYRAKPGDELTARVWRGDVVLLTGDGTSARTYLDPGIRAGRSIEVLIVLILCTLPFLLGPWIAGRVESPPRS